MSDQPCDEPDAQLQQEGLGRSGYVDGVHDIRNSHPDGACQPSVPSAQEKGSQHTEGISYMKGGGISSRHGDLYLKIGK